MKNLLLTLLALCTLAACQSPPPNTTSKPWKELFNGENLDGWTPKFAGSELGVNYKNTFQVQDGVIRVNYDEYDTFSQEFGHLFYKDSFENYVLRVEYRFVGEQVTNGPGWAFKNSGAMLHCQDPASMEVAQDFPVSIEAQFLGGNGTSERPTGNLCTPGTNVLMADTLFTPHCISSTSKTYATEGWVQIDMIVYGDSLIHHVVEGDTVLTYTKPQLDDGTLLRSGYISLQAESHPVEFRKVAIKELDR